jgi:hypothetical protein|tara:strand:+ start:1427 stop:3862 length:2436 start_codon:yes stop_codon:yes gene_type:complete
MAEDPFGPGGPEIEEITIEANPLDQLAIDPEMLELVQNGDGIEMEDGSFEFSMEEGDLEKSQLPFDSNISEHLEDSILYGMSSDILSHISEDKSSRKEWEDAYRRGLELLGIGNDERSQPFQGASGVTHPMLAESATKFQAMAYKELLPAGGPVRTMILGAKNAETEAQADRVKEFMNYQITCEMEEYDPETDQLLFYLPLSGSAFKKVYYDPTMNRPCARFVHAEKLIVPYNTTDLISAQRIAQQFTMAGNELRKLQLSGFYRDIDVRAGFTGRSDVEEEIDKLAGIEDINYDDDVFELYEVHTFLDIEGFEDIDDKGENTGIKLPYIVTLDASSGNVLSIKRNYYENDPLKKPIQYFVHYKFLPGLGFYGFGLPHIIGGMASSATSILRQLIDAGTLANLPAGFKARGIRIRDDDVPLQPGEFRDVDAPGGSLQNSLIPLPFKEPSQTLYGLLKTLEENGRGFAAIADFPYKEVDKNAPVGTTIANLEQGTRVMSAIHKRLHYAQRIEFKLLARLFSDYLPPVYPYMTSNGDQQVKQTDFDERVDIIPISDPNIFSMAQRIALAQTELQLVQSNPGIHGPNGLYESYRRMYSSLGLQNIDEILPRPAKPQPIDPAKENAIGMKGGKLTAFPPQDHDAHIKAHMALMGTPALNANLDLVSNIQSHIYEHMSFKARDMVMQKMQPEIQQLQQQYQGQIPPEVQEQLQAKIEEYTAQEVAGLSELFTQSIEPMEGPDPLVALRQQEINLREADMGRKNEEFQQRLDHDIVSDEANSQVAQDRVDIQEKAIQERTRVAEERIAVQREKLYLDK